MFRCNGNAIVGQTGDSFQISDFSQGKSIIVNMSPQVITRRRKKRYWIFFCIIAQGKIISSFNTLNMQ